MALLPDPTTAASERSSMKNRLTGSRRRGSGIKHKKQAQVQNSQQNEFKSGQPGLARGSPGLPGVQGGSRGVQ